MSAVKRTARVLASLAFTLLSVDAWSATKLVVLTSLEGSEELTAKIERYVRKAAAQEFERIEVRHRADRRALYDAVRSEETSALIWVSHAVATGPTQVPGFSSEPMLVDFQGADVKSILREAERSLRWIGLVACDSEDVARWLNDSGRRIFGIAGQTRPLAGVKAALRDGASSGWNRGSSEPSPRALESRTGEPRVSVEVSRRYPRAGYYPAASVVAGARILEVFPAMQVSDGRHAPTVLRIEIPRTGLKMIFDTGLDPRRLPTGFELGEFAVSAAWPGARWEPFQQPNGTALGKVVSIHRFVGSDPGHRSEPVAARVPAPRLESLPNLELVIEVNDSFGLGQGVLHIQGSVQSTDVSAIDRSRPYCTLIARNSRSSGSLRGRVTLPILGPVHADHWGLSGFLEIRFQDAPVEKIRCSSLPPGFDLAALESLLGARSPKLSVQR